MKRSVTAILLFAAFFTIGGCKQQPNDNDAIRAGILQHLTAVGTLNISAMQMDIRSVSVNGNQARAEVEFRLKGNASGAGMQVAYNLEKRDGAWVVLKTQPLGGAIQHPDPSQNPQRADVARCSSERDPMIAARKGDVSLVCGALVQAPGDLPPSGRLAFCERQ